MVNSWWEIQILCHPMLEEVIFWRLEDFGCRGSASEMKGKSCWIRAYIPQISAHLLDLSALSLWLRQDALAIGFPLPMTKWRLIDEEDWASSWKQYWEPQKIGDHFLIYPAWLEPPTDLKRTLMRLDPGAAFGTGIHPTTQLCLEALEMRLTYGEPKASVIADIGCGSGILSIGAILLGATKAYAVETDPLAVQAALSNRDLNLIEASKLTVKQGSIEKLLNLGQEKIDGICCNILAEVIIDLIPQITELAKPTSWGILSGILLEQAKPIADLLEQYDWIVATLWKRKDWCCFNIRRS